MGGKFIGGKKKDLSSESDGSEGAGTCGSGIVDGGTMAVEVLLGGFLDNTFARVSIVFFRKFKFLLVNCEASSHQLW